MMTHDYRAARDKIMGIVRDANGRPVGYVPSDTPIRERMLIVALVEFLPEIRPANSTLQILLGVSESEVRRLLHSAARRGLIRVETRPGRANRYHLTLPTPVVADTPTRSDTPSGNDRGTPGKDDTPPLSDLTPEADKKADNTSGQDFASQSSAPLSLRNPTPTGKKRSESKRRSKSDDPPDPRVIELRDHYVAEYERTQHAEPVIAPKQWGRAMRALKDLLAATKNLDRAKRIITEAFVTELWDCRGKIQPWEVLANANKLCAKPVPQKTNGRRNDPPAAQNDGKQVHLQANGRY